jgi:hypothetical protein
VHLGEPSSPLTSCWLKRLEDALTSEMSRPFDSFEVVPYLVSSPLSILHPGSCPDAKQNEIRRERRTKVSHGKVTTFRA